MAHAKDDGADATLYKFPRTTHVHNLGAATRDDLVMDVKDAISLLKQPNLAIGMLTLRTLFGASHFYKEDSKQCCRHVLAH